jgi:hypothetical protein
VAHLQQVADLIEGKAQALASATSPLRNPLSDIAVDRLHTQHGDYPGLEGIEDVDVI